MRRLRKIFGSLVRPLTLPQNRNEPDDTAHGTASGSLTHRRYIAARSDFFCGHTRNPTWASHQNCAQNHPHREPGRRVWIHFEEPRQTLCGSGASRVGGAGHLDSIHTVGPPARLRAEVGGYDPLLVRARGSHRHGAARGTGELANSHAARVAGHGPTEGSKPAYVPGDAGSLRCTPTGGAAAHLRKFRRCGLT